MLTPEDHLSISRLQLLAKSVVDGIAAGHHRSPHQGASVEFKEHRQYVRGDEIRSIDWKLFGKTDRLFVRQFEDETNLRAMILVDQSGSMQYRGSRTEHSKHEFAVRLAACLATLLISQRDAVGLATLDTQLRNIIRPRSTASHLHLIYQALAKSTVGAETQLAVSLNQAAGQLRSRGLLILISDCFDDVEALLNALQTFRKARTEVIVFQIFAPDELDFPFRQRTQFRGLEHPATRQVVEPQAIRNSYMNRLAEYRQQLTRGLQQARIDLIACTTNQDLGPLLTETMARRN